MIRVAWTEPYTAVDDDEVRRDGVGRRLKARRVGDGWQVNRGFNCDSAEAIWHVSGTCPNCGCKNRL